MKGGGSLTAMRYKVSVWESQLPNGFVDFRFFIETQFNRNDSQLRLARRGAAVFETLNFQMTISQVFQLFKL